MGLFSYRVDMDFASARNSLSALSERLERMEPIYRDLTLIMKRSIQSNFEESRSPDGKPWRPLKKPSPEGRKPLIKSGNLLSSIRERVASESAIVGTNVVYAAVHQFGGAAGPRRKTFIPARPFMGVRDEDWSKFETAVLQGLLGR